MIIARERREDPAERMLEDTMSRKSTDIKFSIARGRAFARGYWLGFGSASVCALIWIALDLWQTGRLPGWLGG